MTNKMLILRFSVVCLETGMLIAGCGGRGRTGEVTGSMTGAKSGQPLANAQVALCKGTPEESGCEMLSEPTTTTDTNGDFMLTGLDPVSYLLLHAMPGELTSTPEQWGNSWTNKGGPG